MPTIWIGAWLLVAWAAPARSRSRVYPLRRFHSLTVSQQLAFWLQFCSLSWCCRQNRRAEYVSAFWHVLNWGEVNRRLLAAVAARGWELRVPPSQEDVREL